MSDGLLRVLTLISALGSGLMAGFFFAFSVSVMKALGRLPPAQGTSETASSRHLCQGSEKAWANLSASAAGYGPWHR